MVCNYACKHISWHISHRKKSRLRSPPEKTCCKAAQNLTSLAKTLSGARVSEAVADSDSDKNMGDRPLTKERGGAIKPFAKDARATTTATTRTVLFQCAMFRNGTAVEVKICRKFRPWVYGIFF
jgi:hypothetical protein